ncbi:MAG TPA: putative Ig domain-containing protein, partial [Methylophilus sp.]
MYTNQAWLSASGGTAPYTFGSASGLPAGISLNSDGSLTGATCAGNGTYNTISASVTDATTASTSVTGANLIVNKAPAGGCALTFSTTSLPNGSAGVAYSSTITATGGTSPYNYSVSAGTPPPGLSLSAAGTLSGTPSAVGSYSFTVLATDASGSTGVQSYSVTIAASSIAISPASLTSGTAWVAYTQTLSASGGTAPYTYAITTGALPTGLSLSAAGSLSGTPTATGTFNFTVNATDSTSSSGSKSYSLVIAAPTISISPSSLNAGQVNTAYSTSLSASGGTSPYTYTVTTGSL